MKKIKIIDAKDLQLLKKRSIARESIRRELEWRPSEARPEIHERLSKFDDQTKAIRRETLTGYDALEAALDAVNGKATAHTYTAEDICRRIEAAERKLGKHNVAQANRKGVKILFVSEVPTAKSYARKARKAIATRVVVERTSGAWYVTEVDRVERWAGPGGSETTVWMLPEETKTAILRNALADF